MVGGQNNTMLPAEVCKILPNQAFKGKLTDEHTANMITVAAKPPNINAQNIVHHGLSQLGFRNTAPNQLEAFGISIGDQMTVVPARMLRPPGIKYGQGTPQVDDRASWNLRDVKFAKGARLESWGVLVIKDGNRDEFQGPGDPALKHTVQGFASMCRKSGMAVEPKDPMYAYVSLTPKDRRDPTRSAAMSDIGKALKTMPGRPSIILVVLSNGDKHVYNGVKHLCDVSLGICKFLAIVISQGE